MNAILWMQAALPEAVWSSVEEGLTPSVPVTLRTWMDTPRSLTQAQDFNVCIAGGEFHFCALDPIFR